MLLFFCRLTVADQSVFIRESHCRACHFCFYLQPEHTSLLKIAYIRQKDFSSITHFGSTLRSISLEDRSFLRTIENKTYRLNNHLSTVDFSKISIQHGHQPRCTFCLWASSRRTTLKERLTLLKDDLKEIEHLVITLTSYLDTYRQPINQHL